MELWKLLVFYKKRGSVIIVVSLVLSGVSLVFSLKIPPTYEASQSVFVRRESQPAIASFYSYDGYYSQQAAERYTDTVVGFLKNKDVIKKAALGSGLDVSPAGIDKVLGHLKVKRTAPQLVSVSFSDGNRDKAAAFTDNLTKMVAELSRILNASGDVSLVLSNIEDSPFVEERTINSLALSLISFAALFLLTSLVLGVIEVFGESRG